MGKGAAAVGSAIGTAVPAVGLGLGLAETLQGARDERNIRSEFDKLQAPELSNAYKGLKVSTLGSDLRREQQDRLDAELIDAARGSGTRGIVGAAGRIAANSNNVNREIAAGLDEQQNRIDFGIAEDEARLRGIREQRHYNDLNALSSQYQAAKDRRMMGIGNTIQAAGYLGNSLSRMTPSGSSERAITNTASTLSPMGLTEPSLSASTITTNGYDPLSYLKTGNYRF